MWEGMVIEKNLEREQKYKSSIKRYWRSTGQKNDVNWEDVARGRGQVRQQKYPDNVVKYGDLNSLIFSRKKRLSKNKLDF